MKKLTVLVGPQGSGKSTLAKSPDYHGYTYISQDEQGKEGHMQTFERALKNGSDIIVDRINHTREQRARYISKAKEHWYTTEIVELFESYAICYNRMLNREGHPTIKAGDATTVRNALDMYFNQYEMIRTGEADYTIRTARNPIMWDITARNYPGVSDVYVVGDLHGCYTDLFNLLDKTGFRTGDDILISCGDLVDRGPEIMQTIEAFTQFENHFSVRGNHDDKFIRWLRGNKVNTESLKQTIEQFEKSSWDKDSLYQTLMSMPYIIKYGNNYITHAGFFPEAHPSLTSREFSMYARKYDPTMRTFTNDNTKPYWYSFIPEDISYNLYFGHEIHETTYNPHRNVYAMDGGCYMGGTLRLAEIDRVGFKTMYEVESSQPKIGKDNPSAQWDHINKFEPYDKLVEQGYLNKQESGDLVLYNYTDKCTFDKMWNKYTMESRGLILNKVTGDTVARPFPKFFNLFENQTNLNLPNEPYEVYEKLDGSLGILYLDPADNSWKIATRGSFQSEQAKKATEMFNTTKVTEKGAIISGKMWELLEQYHKYTLLFEIIYPANRVNPGARLVVDYGSKETLVILGGIDKVTGKDLHRWDLELLSDYLEIPLAKKFDYTIEEMIALQKTLPATEEGFVVKYDSGFRVKIKGDEYCKMQRILNSITPLFIWELIQEDPEYKLKEEYLMSIPEEILPEVKEIEKKLQLNASRLRTEIFQEYYRCPENNKGWNHLEDKQKLKILGLYAQSPTIRHKSALFLLHKMDYVMLSKYIWKQIRPKANVL